MDTNFGIYKPHMSDAMDRLIAASDYDEYMRAVEELWRLHLDDIKSRENKS